ncbi:putative homeobox protein ceh-1-like [Scophthalmus maximus]|uniref:Putative homeobox protein ceh-1-like n=1 Tax=Scophthalmus maximus TaxID=52904 RepID=A0A2U9BA27_SCOMX|nr:putative homeobox protein ceh-1-like [Scophthalmus maximus]
MQPDAAKLPLAHRTPFSVEDILDPTKFTRKLFRSDDAAAKGESMKRDEPREKLRPPAGEGCGPEESDGSKAKRNRRVRTAFSLEQLHLLERSFHRCHYLSVLERHTVAAALRLSETQLEARLFGRQCRSVGQSTSPQLLDALAQQLIQIFLENEILQILMSGFED